MPAKASPAKRTPTLKAPHRARWIWYDLSEWDLVNTYMLARKTFTLAKAHKRAMIHVTADHRYRLWVNGRYVTRGPARGIPQYQPYDTVDIGPYLRRGRNVIAVRVYQPGVGTFQSVHLGSAGLLMESARPRLPIDTGESWRVKRDESIRRDVVRASLQLSHQEHVDADKEEIGWRELGFDDSAWSVPHARGHGPFPPFTSLEPRGIPQMREEIVPPIEVVACFAGTSARGYRDTRNITRTFLDDRTGTKTDTQLGQRIRASGMSLTLPRTGKGRAGVAVIDFGRTVTGSAIVEVEGVRGAILDLLYSESVDDTGRPIILDPDMHCRMALADRLIMRKGPQTFEVFDYRGFRYLTLVLRDAAKPVRLKRLALRRVEYPVALRGRFGSSEPLLDRLFEVGAWTQRNCMFDAFVDCPWREQAQWWGDARIQARVAHAAFGDTQLVARGIRQAAQTQLPDGLTYGHFPTIAYHCILPDFTLTWIGSIEDHYLATGDRTLARSLWPNIEKALDWFKGRLAGPGLLGPEADYWLFLDWAPIYKEGYSAVYNMLYLEGLRSAARLARIAAQNARAREIEKDAQRLARAITRTFFDRRAGLWREGATLKGRRLRKTSVHANALAVLLELDGWQTDRLYEKALLPAIERRAGIVDASPFFYVRVIDALKKLGRHEKALAVIRERWGRMLETGATTFYEVWEPEPGSGSRCHAWSASPVFYLHEIILGVERLAPGWTRVRIAPRPCGVDHAEGRVPTRLGDIEVRWRRDGDEMILETAIPRGMRAHLQIGGTTRSVGPGKHRLRGRL